MSSKICDMQLWEKSFPSCVREPTNERDLIICCSCNKIWTNHWSSTVLHLFEKRRVYKLPSSWEEALFRRLTPGRTGNPMPLNSV